MMRKLVTCLLMIVLVTAWPASGAYAQIAPARSVPAYAQNDEKNPKDTSGVGFEAGKGGQADSGNSSHQGSSSHQKGPSGPPSVYSTQVGSVLIGAFDQAMSELDAAPANPTPQELKDLTYRRRILELRLLMDTNDFMYNHDQMKVYRDVVDAAYQAVGDYGDISVIEKLLDGYNVSPDVVNARLNQMNASLEPLRDQGWRNQVHAFFADPRPTVRTSPGSPRLWDKAGTRASDQSDEVGNVALLEASVLRALAGQDLGVSNIFDPDQIVQFHAVRKDVRSMLVLAKLFPEINDSIQGEYKTLDDLNDQYDDTHDAYNAWIVAKQAGLDTSAITDKVNHEFDQAQDAKNAVISTDALTVAASHIDAVRDAHRVK
jgi:hypothetical protein